MKKLIFCILFLLANQIYATDTSYLFFQSSSQATLTKLDQNNYRLTLDKLPLYINYFTDRPIRKSGILPLPKFLSLWSNKNIKNNFINNPPNAALALVSNDGKRQDFVAVITNPVYENGKLSYQVSTLNNQYLPPENLKYVMLFFDDIHWNPGGF